MQKQIVLPGLRLLQRDEVCDDGGGHFELDGFRWLFDVGLDGVYVVPDGMREEVVRRE